MEVAGGNEIKYTRMQSEHEAAALQNIVDNFYEDEVLIRGTNCCRGGDKHPELEQVKKDETLAKLNNKVFFSYIVHDRQHETRH